MKRSRLWAIAGLVVIVGVAVGVVVTTGDGGKRNAEQKGSSSHWLHSVLTALTATTGANSYAFSYTTIFQPRSEPGARSTVLSPTTSSGHGVVNLNPYVMVTTNSADSSFPNVTAVFDSTRAWEFGAANYGTGPSIPVSPGNSLSGFAQLVEGSLGEGQGALAMVSLASPTGRLDLDPSMMSGAQQLGAGTVDGVAVTNYRVAIDFPDELDRTQLSDEQRTTITQALAILRQQGYVGTTEVVSVDTLGFIRETKTAARFADGGSVTSDNVLSEIGCAGTVVAGDPVPTPPPPGCVSPDQPGAQSAVSTSTSVAAPGTTSQATSTTTVAPTTTIPAEAGYRGIENFCAVAPLTGTIHYDGTSKGTRRRSHGERRRPASQ